MNPSSFRLKSEGKVKINDIKEIKQKWLRLSPSNSYFHCSHSFPSYLLLLSYFFPFAHLLLASLRFPRYGVGIYDAEEPQKSEEGKARRTRRGRNYEEIHEAFLSMTTILYCPVIFFSTEFSFNPQWCTGYSPSRFLGLPLLSGRPKNPSANQKWGRTCTQRKLATDGIWRIVAKSFNRCLYIFRIYVTSKTLGGYLFRFSIWRFFSAEMG